MTQSIDIGSTVLRKPTRRKPRVAKGNPSAPRAKSVESRAGLAEPPRLIGDNDTRHEVRNGDAATYARPSGGVQKTARLLHAWRWNGDGFCAPIRCKSEQWFLARAGAADPIVRGPLNADAIDFGACHVEVCFHDKHGAIHSSVVCLESPGETGDAMRYGWIQAPIDATHLQVRVPAPIARSRSGTYAAPCAALTLHPTTERDAKCHPLANVPRWSTYSSGFPIERIVLPRALADLAPLLGHARIEIIDTPASIRKLAAKAIGAAMVIDPAWVAPLQLRMSDIETIAAGSWMIIDLPTVASLARAARVVTTARERTHRFGAMTARVEYADVPTRGLALQDVVPYGTFDGQRFSLRVLEASRSWKRYAEATGFALMLSSQTPTESQCNDVVACLRAVGQGDLIATDLPWIAAGLLGRPAAPQLARHMLATLLGGPVAETAHFWNRWDDIRVVLRDIGDMARRYVPLAPVRWTSGRPGAATLGVEFNASRGGPDRAYGGSAAGGEAPSRCLTIRTGRMDRSGVHDGLAPEPMMIYMKWLAREWREQTSWSRSYLAGARICWQFESEAGLKYAPHFDAAPSTSGDSAGRLMTIQTGSGWSDSIVQTGSVARLEVPRSVGFLGDGSIEFQVRLSHFLNKWIEQSG